MKWIEDPKNQNKKKKYTDYLKILNKLLNIAKEEYHSENLRKVQDSRQLWKYIKDNICRRKNVENNNKIQYINEKNKEKLQIANKLLLL